MFYPLHAYVCDSCHLVQLEEFESREGIFDHYLYFSSYSDAWLAHSRRYAENMTSRYSLGNGSKVIEVASNDGYLLQYFHQQGIQVLGVEPAKNVAQVAIDMGIPTMVGFFGRESAQRLLDEGHHADLMAANNVLAHVPDLHDFVAGFKILLKPRGVLTVEFPALINLITQNQFDTIYHEHFSYLSLHSAGKIFGHHGLAVFDLEELPTHGGSFRLHVCHAGAYPETPAVAAMRQRERTAGLEDLAVYRNFGRQVIRAKMEVLQFFVNAHREGKRVVGYGAPAKGNTLLNYCGIGPESMAFTVDRSPHKQGHLLPGTRIPIRSPDAIRAEKPDYVFILPWNLRDEVAEQMADIRDWGGRFVVPIPSLEIF